MRHCYIYTVTEDEINHGIFRVASSEDSCLCYTRTMTGLSGSLEDKNASRYIDVLPGVTPVSIDSEAQSLLADFKQDKLPKALSNIREYSIPWVSGGLSKLVPEHELYLKQLCEHIKSDVKDLIDRALRSRKIARPALHVEVLHHASLCLNKCALYCDRKDGVIAEIEKYISSTTSHPLILHGKSGSGKTSILAKAARDVCKCSDGCYLVLRFLGTSPQSTFLREVLVSVCDQVCSLYSLAPPAFGKMDTIDTIQYFRNDLFVSLSKFPNCRLVLMLDSIDQLSPMDGTHSLKWLPLQLPPNVRIVISMLNEVYDSVHSTTSHTDIELGSMHLEAGSAIINLWLSNIGRKITDEQKAIVMNAFRVCPQPLFLKLLFGLARTWKSYTDCGRIQIPHSTKEALFQFYESMEEQFGAMLIKKALGYFTATRGGLTEAELEDVLSLDNEVLNDVYQYWDPPVKGVVRIPSLLWKRIRHFIGDYVVEQQADGMTVLVWYHRQFNESARSRYVEGGSKKSSLHFILAEFFQGTWGNGKGKSVKLLHRGLDLEEANRQVPAQPIKFSETLYNLRKLSQLPHHLLHSEQADLLKDLVLCNFDWIYAKLKATAFPNVIQDYVMALSTDGKDADISLISEALSLSSNNLKSNADFLAGQLLGRLLASPSSPSLCDMLADAKKWVSSANRCVLQPLNNCLISPGGELKVTITGHPQVVLGVVKASSLPLLVSYSKGSGCDVFQVWDVTSLECIENLFTFKLHGKSLPAFNYTIMQEHLVVVNTQSYAVWNIKTGDNVEYIKNLASGITCVSVTHDQCVLVGAESGQILHSSNLSCPVVCEELKSDNVIASFHSSTACKLTLVLSGMDCVSGINSQEKMIVNSTKYDHTSFTALLMVESSDGQTVIVAGTSNGKLCISDVPALNFTSVDAHSKAVKCISHLPTQQFIITGSLDKTVCVWDMKKWSLVRRLKGHVDGVWCLDSIPGTTKVVSGSKDDYLKVWDTLTGECLHTLEGHSSWISCVAAITSDVVVSGSNDKNLKFWKLDFGKKAYDSCNRHSAQPECIALSGTSLAASGGPDAVKIWSPLSGKLLKSLPTSASCLTFASGGNLLITGSKAGTIEIFEATNWTRIKAMTEHTNKITSFLLAKKDSQELLISASLDSTLQVWHGKSYGECSTLSRHKSGVTCLAYSKSEGLLASGSQDGNICLWDITHSKCTAVLTGHTKAVACLDFTPDGTHLISGSDDTTACVWITSDGNCAQVIRYTDSVKALCAVSDSMFIAGAHCGHNQLKSWSTKTGECAGNFVAHTHAVMCMLIVDSQHILTGSRDGTIRIWDHETSTLVSTIDLQSQVKHISLTKIETQHFLLAATTKSGPIAFLKFVLPHSLDF